MRQKLKRPHWTRTVLLACACAIYGTGSPRSVGLFLELSVKTIRDYDPFCLEVFRSPLPCNKSTLESSWKNLCAHRLDHSDWKRAHKAVKYASSWGKLFWQALHNLSALFTETSRESLLQVFFLLPFVLPCRNCRVHAYENISAFRVSLEESRSRYEFVNTVIDLHNYITLQIKKPDTWKVYDHIPEGGASHVSTTLKILRSHGASTKAVVNEQTDKDCGCTS